MYLPYVRKYLQPRPNHSTNWAYNQIKTTQYFYQFLVFHFFSEPWLLFLTKYNKAGYPGNKRLRKTVNMSTELSLSIYCYQLYVGRQIIEWFTVLFQLGPFKGIPGPCHAKIGSPKFSVRKKYLQADFCFLLFVYWCKKKYISTRTYKWEGTFIEVFFVSLLINQIRQFFSTTLKYSVTY